MPNLSTPIGDLRARYDVVVIGSGYGGAVVARVMAESAQARRKPDEKPLTVCVLERGLEIRPGQYPTSLLAALRAGQIDTSVGHFGRQTSLFDLRMNRDLTVLVGCGLGGTSLINASVILEPKDFSDPSWPEDLRALWPEELQKKDALKSEFDDVKKALGAVALPDDIDLDKVTRLIESATGKPKQKGNPRQKETSRKDHLPPIAVSFHTHINAFGVQQGRCTLCGNCITGCNHSAKNTLIMNYLPAAATAGASIFCGMQVAAIEPSDERPGDWLVHTRILDRGTRLFGSPEVPIRAGMVFLASGTLGSTEILLRSRDRYGLSLSPALGKHFSGNGDVIAFGYNVEERVNGMGYGSLLPHDAAVGPTIAGMLDERSGASGAMIQEGAVPGALGFLLRFAGPIIARVSRLGVTTRADFSIKSLWRELVSLLQGAHHGALARTQTFLGMSFDDGHGEIRLSKRNRVRIAWTDAGSQPVFTRIAKRLAALTVNMHGSYVVNPIWTRMFGRRLVIAHPLGGCALADNPAQGVVNSWGEVYRVSGDGERPPASTSHDVYKGLYVCDGAIVPTPLGTNPSLTIAALAQRIAVRAAKIIVPAKGDRDDAGDITPRRTDSGVVGLRYAERLKGSMRLRGHDTRVELFLHISADSVEQLLSHAAHEAKIVGVVHTPDLGNGHRRFTISEGTLNVAITDNRRVDTKLLVYRLKLTPTDTSGPQLLDERPLWLRGHKTINYDTCKRSLWKTATRLPFVLFDKRPDAQQGLEPYDGCEMVDLGCGATEREQFLRNETARKAGVVGVGLAGGRLLDVLRLAASMEVLHEPRLLRRVHLAFRFQWQFVDALVQARVWGLRRTDRLNPFERNVVSRPPMIDGEPHPDLRRPGRERYLLTRFLPPPTVTERRRPVVLVPGFSMSTYWFRAAMPQRNITQYLLDHGHEVWLLDYRSSDRLNASLEQFTLDELAESDFPDAIEQVSNKVEDKVHIIAHCVGSISVLMSLLSGNLAKRGVHSIILSQAVAFIDQPFVNRLKAKLHLAEILRLLGLRPILTPDFDLRSSVAVRLLDRLLYFYPSRERCKSGVCRRLLLIYGDANRHDQLDAVTHDLIYDMVDRGNLTTLAQLEKMAARRKIVNAAGKDVYLTCPNGKNVNVPITLLQGARNNLFRRSGAHKTRDWLHRHGGFDSPEERQEKFTLLEVPDFGHMDVFIGRNSERKVYPKILKALERMESLSEKPATS
jgi:cholesterol oxidase